MGDYYNKTKGPIAVTTRRGSSVSVGSKKWLTLSSEDEGHESLQRAVTKGFLVRSSSPAPVEAPAPVAAPAVVSVYEMKATPVTLEVVSVLEAAPPTEEKLKTFPVAPVRSGKKGR